MRSPLLTLATPLAFLAAGAAAAGTVTEGDVPGGTGGIPYTWQVDIAGDGDSAEVVDSAGSKSWADPMNPGGGSNGLAGGWTHNSGWIHLELAEPVERLSITLGPNADVPDGVGGFLAGDLVPALSLWSGADNDGAESHSYQQMEVPTWIDAAGFAFLESDTVGPGPFVGAFAIIERDLAAGVYTVAVGGHDDVASSHLAGYTLEIAALPEPAAPLLAAVGAAVLAAARRARHRRA
jgi:hypothetical protein